MKLSWEKLLNQKRRKQMDRGEEKSGDDSLKIRTETERDHDRILFSTPVRRLADKTQVFPLERKDNIRTRLTHSIEVSNIARSIGINLAFNNENLFPEELQPKRNIPAMLAAIGLAHDLGNPPFGHQGESAIQTWFKGKKGILGDGKAFGLDNAKKEDFFRFEGNAQTLRLVTRLQILDDEYGLDLTCGTLAALMKYTVPSDKVDKHCGDVAKKKHGYFQSEKKIIETIFEETGLEEGVRHPLTFIMEAADDIAYSVLDVEDAVKKSLLSFHDIIAYLEQFSEKNEIINDVCIKSKNKHNDYKKNKLSPSELNEISTQRFRVFAIDAMVNKVTASFIANYEKIMEGVFNDPLLKVSEAFTLYEELKHLALNHAYKNRSVLEIELKGNNEMHELMDELWKGVVEREDETKLNSDRKDPYSKYVYGRISEGYRRVFENENFSFLPDRYREAQVLTDMVSGMTDNYLIELNNELKQFKKR